MDKRTKHIKRPLFRGFPAMILTVETGYDAVLFIGYHAKAGTPDGVMSTRWHAPSIVYKTVYPCPRWATMHWRHVQYSGDVSLGDGQLVIRPVNCSGHCYHISQGRFISLFRRLPASPGCLRSHATMWKALSGHRCVYRMEGPYTMYCSIRRNYDAPNIENITGFLEEALHLFWTLT